MIYSGLLSAGMSGLVALIVTTLNTGLDGGLVLRWLAAWGIAFPVAWLAALFWGRWRAVSQSGSFIRQLVNEHKI